MSISQPRAKFSPNVFDAEEVKISPLETGTDCFQPVLTCSADFPIELFESAISQLVHHPEYNSTLILRSEVLSESRSIFPPETPDFRGFSKVNYIHRRLLPRRPGRDGGLEQYCTFYSRMISEPNDMPDTLVLTPIIPPGSQLPYYHPAVFHIAFRYLCIADRPSTLRIEVLPLPGTPIDSNSRLYRTCLALLETLHRYGWGAMVNYKKRVVHDHLVPREEYQDLYLVMRERHKHLVDTWQEVTDPLKHVFEDIGIATFLMLFWKETYTHQDHMNPEGSEPDCPWFTWPRPPGGFLDFGCGNGLLTHILTAEGYQGKGIDVRARASWAQYPDTTREQLHVYAFDPTSKSSCSFIRSGVFIIGNHADELTPWVPVLATLHKASGYLSIPCCAWSFDAKFERSSASFFPIPISPTGLDLQFVEGLNLGGDGSHTSSYSIYRIWLSTLSLHCGWEIECEMLRIPSTRNWAIAGRRRLPNVTDEEALENAQAIIEQVVTRGVFKTRHPEGKARDH
ncbi:hypothetical protein AGABI2DRAFT_209065 [Agaricus bisporus var. bisporus H97]|uniref:hypothetical protein n=1 Tax=Agaricus bisporus var. bisporus (strain H97 / ATCC MYA-4626 / FGSC 10389) TaxID=936046 RepID=UPI00029F54DE|nr:hypothetical protein AGABI2DRAFT_209065 [Agaricus bisporus var. bisporus H97]EKV44715.1 hypothetical protein AGABI2DRAFT_209065 [Agaricus bisporus var. bisporus H97]